MEMSPAVAVTALEKAFARTRALEGVDLVAPPGAFVVLLGPHGAGKSTLLSLVAGLAAPDRGRIAIAGRDVAHSRGMLGVVLQEPALDLERSLRANLRYQADIHGIDRATGRTRIAAALDRLDLRANESDRVHSLSPANRRRLELARAMLHQPSVLLLDDITSGLDLAGRRALLADARRASSAEHAAVLWATHRVDEVDAGDRLVVLNRGRIAFDGIASDLPARIGQDSIDAAYRAMVDHAEAADAG